MTSNQKKQYTIAILSGDTQSDFSENTLRDLYVCAQKEDVNIVFLKGPTIPQYCKDILEYNAESDYNNQFKSIFDYVHFVQADALIVFGGSISSYLNLEGLEGFLDQYAQIPYILVQLPSNDESVPYFVADNYGGMKRCVEHLVVEHGYRKIAFLSGPKANPDARERLAAYKEVMRANKCLITQSMIAYGNYTENVDEQVRMLMDQNIGLEAIVCANDNMAKACYRVCQERNLVIGKDIAITGFDDVEMAREMEPPLTSVSQNSYLLSYEVLKAAINLCDGKQVLSQKLPLKMQIRSSCGCKLKHISGCACCEKKEWKSVLAIETEEIISNLLNMIPYEEEKEHYASIIREFFQYIYNGIVLDEGKIAFDCLSGWLRELLEYIPLSSTSMSSLFVNLLEAQYNNMDDPIKKEQMIQAIKITRQEIIAYNMRETEREIKSLNRKLWFVPSLTRDLTRSGTKNDLHEVFFPIMQRLQTMNVKSCYIYLFQEPIIYQSTKRTLFPRTIYLTAYYNRNAIMCYPNVERPRVTERKGFLGSVSMDESAVLVSFVLFSEDRQYGILFCEVEPDDIPFMFTCSMQIGSLMRSLEMNWAEQDSAAELRDSLNIIQEHNKILNFISDYDELTQLYNRRGFMERAISFCAKNEGRESHMVFFDLDHLKEINDCFGHSAGDFAIRSAADMMRESLPEKAVIGRIGGDEFVAIVLADKLQSKEEVIASVKEEQNRFNASCDQQFYTEFSVGVYTFVCAADIDINSLIQKSDEIMYEAKKRRRGTVKK